MLMRPPSSSKDVRRIPSTHTRLDCLLVERGYFISREKAQRAILAGLVCVRGQRASKSGSRVSRDIEIVVAQKDRYVSRGGLKLEAALQYFHIDVEDVVCLDIGASTGGFTDCLLKHGARLVYAVDVGYGQLDWSLRNDSRVILREKTNARHLRVDEFSLPIELVAIDVSFISLTCILPVVAKIAEAQSQCSHSNPLAQNRRKIIIFLIKPQFELDRYEVSRGGGIIRDDTARNRAIHKIQEFAVNKLPEWHWEGFLSSPILGAKGNQEYLGCLILDQ